MTARPADGALQLLIAANLGAWGWALFIFRHHPVLLGTALLAYSFGLRQAVDDCPIPTRGIC